MTRIEDQREKRESVLRRWADVGRSFFRALRAVGTLVRTPDTPTFEPEHLDVRFERTDVASKQVVITGFSILGVMWLCAFLLFLYFRYTQTHVPTAETAVPPLVPAEHALPPQPRLQTSPRSDYQNELAFETDQLHRYSWIDRSKGIVGIPIERAMQLIVERGIPPQPAPADLKLYPPQAGTRDTGFRGKIEPEPR